MATTRRGESPLTPGLALPGVTAASKPDGTPILRVAGRFMAGIANHPSAEPNTLAARLPSRADCQLFLAEAPDTYYVTPYYRKYPVILARLDRLTPEALADLLAVARRATLATKQPPDR